MASPPDGPTGASLPPAIQHRHTPEADIITWVNKSVVNHVVGSIVLLWGVWFGGVGWAVLVLFREGRLDEIIPVLLIWIAGIILIPVITAWALFQRVTLKIGQDEFTIIKSGLTFPKKRRLPKERIIALVFEPFNKAEYDPTDRLHLLYKTRWRYLGDDLINLASWMDEEDELALFLLLRDIMRSRGWDIDYRLQLER